MKVRLYALGALWGLASMAVLAAPNNMPKTGLAKTTHDIGGNGCKGCHAPHNGSVANGGTDQNTGKILLWSRNFPAAANTFGVYDSATMGNKAAEVGGSSLSTSSDVRMYTLLCLSCHDGVTSSFSPTMQQKNAVGYSTRFGGSTFSDSGGLTNDHPINMVYDPTKSSELLQTVAMVSATLPLYGSTNTVQCSTCHEPHNNANTNYMRQTNDTTHCTTCHL